MAHGQGPARDHILLWKWNAFDPIRYPVAGHFISGNFICLKVTTTWKLDTWCTICLGLNGCCRDRRLFNHAVNETLSFSFTTNEPGGPKSDLTKC